MGALSHVRREDLPRFLGGLHRRLGDSGPVLFLRRGAARLIRGAGRVADRGFGPHLVGRARN